MKKLNIFYLLLISISLQSQNNHRTLHYVLDKDTPEIWVDSIGNLLIDNSFIYISSRMNKVKIKTNKIIDSKTLYTNHEMFPYLQDKNHVYYIFKGTNDYAIKVIDSVDLNSFIVKNNKYAKDKNKVYFNGNIIKEGNTSDFIILNRYYGKDKSNVYYNGEIIKGADANSFELYEPENIGFLFLGRDKKHFYEGNSQVEKEYLKSHGLWKN